MPDVSFSGRRVPLAEVQEHPSRHASALERAKRTPGHALCHCRPSLPRKLVIRRYGTLFHLAGWPDDGVNRVEGCDFRKDAQSKTSVSNDSTAAIVCGPDGLDVRLDASLVQRDGLTSTDRAPETGGGARASRRSAPLLAFIHALWESAGLSSWSSTSMARGWGAVNSILLAGLGDSARINGAAAEDALHIMRRYEESGREAINAEFDAFMGRITNDGSTSRRALLLGEIGDVAATQYGYAITLRQRKQRYFTTPELAERAQKSYAHAWRAIGVSDARVIALLLVERTTKGHLRAVDLAMMLCSSAFLPCDSIHEVAMANRLVAERRVFEKPIRMTDGDDMLPDFVLLDTRPPTHIEVYGMNGLATYERRKQEKQRLRAERGIPAVEWNIDRETLNTVLLPPSAAQA
ncbi:MULTISPECIES: DUF1173 family protein [unclassified Paraburkholderia]|uniref:DUF1173 family protein n=1 Tax=unclassified Paraburkholderia TaxID=2615204 RepID=UPI002AB14759|nr:MULTISPECIES: DUF1173 family protein [unclassified Paraburkholderia]